MYYTIICILIPVLILAVTLMICLMRLVRFAKEHSFGAAFQIKEICRIISDIGWLRYLRYRYLRYICLLDLILSVVEVIILPIPIIDIFVMPLVMAFVLLFQGRFVANLYETASD